MTNGQSLSREVARGARHEDVARGRALAAGAEELEQVVELAVNVAADGDRAGDGVHRGLLQHELLHVLAQVLQGKTSMAF